MITDRRQNPGKFTLQGSHSHSLLSRETYIMFAGTNTYLIGSRNPFILVDTGEGNDDYIPHLHDALKEASGTSQPTGLELVSDIVLTHRHHDHIGGLPSVLALLRHLWGEKTNFRLPRIHMFPLSPMQPDITFQSPLDKLSTHSFTTPEGGGVIHQIQTLQTLHGQDVSLQALHTPGHTTDSICLYLIEEKALFTADSVLGQGTAIFEDLTAYIASLRSLLKFESQPAGKLIKLYPGHGPTIADGRKLIESYIQHRIERENQIIGVLSLTPPSGEAWTLGALVANLYAEYPPSLWARAAHGVHLHLMKLQKENTVRNLGGENQDTKWELLSKL